MFTVIYKWKVFEDKEQQFIESWKKVTEILYIKHGSLGSRLHKTYDGFFLAYAQWPDLETWEKDKEFTEEEQIIRNNIQDSVEERFEPITCDVLDDLLKTVPAKTI